MNTSRIRFGFKRVIAYLIDCFLILIYAVILFNVSILINESWPYFQHFEKSYLIRHLVSFSTLTLPALLYFVCMEYSKKRGSLGKIAMKIEVRSVNDKKQSFKTLFLRNSIKLMPWEIAHLTYQLYPDFFRTGEISSAGVFIGFGFSYGILFIFILMVFLRNDGRTLHDLLSNTRVVNIYSKPIMT